MPSKWEHTEADRSSQQHLCDRDGETLNHANSYRYQIDACQPLKIAGSGFFICWWIFLAYMVFTSHKEGFVSCIAAYGFLSIGLFAMIYVVAHLKREKFLVNGRTITQYCTFAPHKTYQIHEITKVVIHKHIRGATGFQVYIGKKKIFTLHDGMVNYDLFLATLRENQVPFQNSVF